MHELVKTTFAAFGIFRTNFRVLKLE